MIALESRARQGRLLPVCRVKRCRSAATETLMKDGVPWFCARCLCRLLSLKPDPKDYPKHARRR